MATISRAESLLHNVTTPTISTKPLPSTLNSTQRVSKPTASQTPRVDVEPIYTALKTAIGDNWPLYKESFSLFITGQLNQEELSRRIDSFICVDRSREYLHNQLVCAVYTNAGRDPPEPGVAVWVSANDKPLSASKPVTGDAAEQRLKTEVMQLPPRERHRLKSMQEDPTDRFNQAMMELHNARSMNKLPDIVPTSAGGYNAKTNWEIEIHKRYAQPLFAESNEFPEPETVLARLTPICYEEGLHQGSATGCADFINIAAESYVKELVSDIFHRTRSNGATYVKTGAYKRKLEREEASWAKGKLARNAAGLLPAEAEAARRHPPLNLLDIRLALDLGNTYLSQLRLVSDRLLVAPRVDNEDDGADQPLPAPLPVLAAPAPPAVPLTNGVLTNGVHHDVEMRDAPDWLWAGGLRSDVDNLASVLDDCLVVGQ